MRSNIRLNSESWRAVLVGFSLCICAALACSHVANPFSDDLLPTESVTTASVAGVQHAAAPLSIRTRSYAAATAESSDGAVTHWPLWYEDPFEDKGSDDGEFKWTAEDALAFPYGLGRFILNTMGLPASMAVQPPWTVLCSDGKLSRQALGYDHDAERCPGAIMPIDMFEIGTTDEEPPQPPAAPEPGRDAAP